MTLIRASDLTKEHQMINRRDFMKLSAIGGGAVFLSGLARLSQAEAGGNFVATSYDDSYFVQLSDTQWGYQGPANPEAANTLRKAVATVNGLSTNPVTDYELERIREEQVLDGWRQEPADAPLPSGSSMDKRKGGLAQNQDAEPSGRRIKPLD
jgi:hypothetical protein